ncbi:protein DpdD [Variovorax humicola]|uniref:Protein DpdD n=1 Tax=Variovorax humicola TaxID=1769758 RepID=A0ABU8WAZ4_9BURK
MARADTHGAQQESIAQATAMLQAFFSAPNSFVVQTAEQKVPARTAPAENVQTVPAPLLGAIQYYAGGGADRSILIPFRRPDGDAPVVWYACAHDELAMRALSAELGAFVGPSYADFERMDLAVDTADQVVVPILKKAGLRHLRFLSIRKAYDAQVIKQWEMYWDLIARRPKRAVAQPRNFAQLRADFDRALIAKNEVDAMSTMAALREQHGLSLENRAFLEIRLAAALGRWSAITGHRLLSRLVQLRVPPETFGDIQEALYEVHLRMDEQATNASHLLQSYRDDVMPIIAPLQGRGGASRRPAVRKMQLLHELVQGTPSAAMCLDLLNEVSSSSFGAAGPDIQSRVKSLQPRSGFKEAEHEMSLARYEQAYLLLWPLNDNAEVLGALLRCACELGDAVRATAVSQRVLQSPAGVSVQNGEYLPLLRDVQKLAAPVLEVESWQGRLSEPASDTGSGKGVVERWRETVRSLDAREALKEHGFAAAMAQQIEELVIEYPLSFEVLYPLWFEWVIERCPPDSRFASVYAALIEALFARDRFGDSDLELMRQSAMHLVHAGPTPAQYKTLIDRLVSVFETARSPSGVGWGLEVADGLAVAPCRDVESRTRWLSLMVQAGIEFQARLRAPQRLLLEMLASEAGVVLPASAVTPSEHKVDEGVLLRRRILLYSLDVQAVQRAALILRQMFPNANVESNVDEVCTPRLKSASGSADWIVFVAAVATHQAFFCIKGALRQDAKLLQVEGTGTTRIVDRVVKETAGFASAASSDTVSSR